MNQKSSESEQTEYHSFLFLFRTELVKNLQTCSNIRDRLIKYCCVRKDSLGYQWPQLPPNRQNSLDWRHKIILKAKIVKRVSSQVPTI